MKAFLQRQLKSSWQIASGQPLWQRQRQQQEQKEQEEEKQEEEEQQEEKQEDEEELFSSSARTRMEGQQAGQSLGSVGHPELCHRPCVHLLYGRCAEGHWVARKDLRLGRCLSAGK